MTDKEKKIWCHVLKTYGKYAMKIKEDYERAKAKVKSDYEQFTMGH